VATLPSPVAQDRTSYAQFRMKQSGRLPTDNRTVAPGISDLPKPRIGVRIALCATAPGVVELHALPDHRVKVHAGAPVRVSCRHQRSLYQRGDVDILPAGLSDTWQEDDAGTSLLLEFSPLLLQRVAEDAGLDASRTGLEPRCQVKDPHIEHIAWALDAERKAGHPNGLLYAESIGIALAVHLLGRFGITTPRTGGLSKLQLRQLAAYIEEHLDQDLSIGRLARVAGISASHLKTLFRRSTGLPVHRYVIQRRVERARDLLGRGELPASQVALEAGFAHQSHMARWMRRLLGVAPRYIIASS
jgi:AraC family transcriptional regulator